MNTNDMTMPEMIRDNCKQATHKLTCMIRFLTVLCALIVCSIGSAASEAKPSAIDKRAVAIFDRAILGLKKYRSFSLAAEEYILDTSPPQKRFAAGSLQWPYRAELKITGDKVDSQALVERDRALFWNGDSTITIPVKTQTERERQILHVFESSPPLALGLVSLRAGINPACTPLVKAVDYARVAGDSIEPRVPSSEQVYFRVRLTRITEDAARPLLLTYFFSKDARLDRLEIAHTIGGKLFRTRADFDPIFVSENFLNDQVSTDRYVYGWEEPKNTQSTDKK